MAAGLRAINRCRLVRAIDRLGLRDRPSSLIHGATRRSRGPPPPPGGASPPHSDCRVRRASRAPRRRDLFDLTPTDEQTILRDSVRDFAADRLRPAALRRRRPPARRPPS